MSRGGRGPRSRIAGNLLLFTPLVISWQGRGNLPFLKTIERADLKAPQLKRQSLLSAMYINELLMHLLHRDDAHESVFERYHECLYALQDEDRLEISLRAFEIRLLELLGFGLNLLSDADSGEPVLATKSYHYHPDHGPVLSQRANPVDAPLISGACLLALAEEDFDSIARSERHLQELKQLMRVVIAQHLGGKQLKSRELFRPAGH